MAESFSAGSTEARPRGQSAHPLLKEADACNPGGSRREDWLDRFRADASQPKNRNAVRLADPPKSL